MSTGSENRTTLAEDLSALVDGELHEGAVSGACGSWRGDGSARATWHAYQLIGDVLRSEDLASDPARDASFLSALRGRLSREPVILAPQAAALPAPTLPIAADRAARRGRWSWAAPSAVAAGFVAVAGVLVVTRTPTLPSSTPAVAGLAAAPAQSGGAMQVAGSGVAPSPASDPVPYFATGKVIRDAGLDRYLAAHKHFAGSAALGVPSAFLRSATMDASGR